MDSFFFFNADVIIDGFFLFLNNKVAYFAFRNFIIMLVTAILNNRTRISLFGKSKNAYFNSQLV